MNLEYGFSVGTVAHKLRRFKRLHTALQWIRRDLLSGIVEGLLELLRWTFRRSHRIGPPIYTFSVYRALRAGDPNLNGEVILEDQGNPLIMGGSLLARGTYEQDREQPWPIFWSEHRSARLASTSLALMQGKRVCIESVYGLPRLRSDPAYRSLWLPRAVKLHGNWTSIISRWVPTAGKPNYTHWLLDGLPRLALLPRFPEDTQILIPAALYDSQKESLALLGLLERCRATGESHLEVERFFFSSPTTMLEGYNPYGIDFLRRSFLPRRALKYSGPKKFFVARYGSARNPLNMTELCQLFTDMGWGIVQPGQLSFAEQVKLFSDAEAICGTVGSGMTNAVFCQPGCRILLLAQDFMADSWLEWISQVIKADFHFLLCQSGYRQTICPDLEEVKKLLARLGYAG